MDNQRLRKKYILAGNILNARKYVICQANNGLPLFNYEECTTTMLVNMLKDNDQRMISDKEATYIIYLLFKQDYSKYVLKENTKYDQETFTIKSVAKLLELINDYRLSEVDVKSQIFDIEYQVLLNDYLDYLSQNNLTDYIILLDEIKNSKVDATLLVLDDLVLSPKERKVFNNCFNEVKDIRPISFNKQIISTFPCYGIYNEILNVLDIIKKNNYSINDCEIVYCADKYENLLRGTLDAFNIKYSIASAHAKSTNIISFMLDTLNYVKNNYSYQELESVLKNNGLQDIYLKEFYKSLNNRSFSYAVGFGYDRTKEFIDILNNKKSVEHIKEFLVDLLAFNNGNRFDYELFCSFVYKYLDNGNEKNVLQEKIDNIKHIVDLSDNKIDSAIEELSALRYTENVNNTLQLSLLNKSFSLKKHLFIIGLSQSNVTKIDSENPFILDVDKYYELLGKGKYLHVLRNLKDANIEALDYYLKNSDSDIYLSYAYFDKVEFKPSAPSIYYLNKQGISFDKDLNNGVNKYAVEINHLEFKEKVNEGENNPIKQSYDNGNINELVDELPHLDKIITIKQIVDNIELPTLTLSPSALQTLISCPFQYYYEKIVHLPSPDYPSVEVDGWLGANAKGTFFHEVLELYGNATGFKGAFNNIVFDEVFNQAFNNTKKLNQIKNEAITLDEKEEVKEQAIQTIKSIIDDYLQTGYHLLACEYNLENTEYDYNNIKFSGIVDRIDYQLVDKTLHLRIVDYKTGKSHTKEDNYYLQHVVYSACLENSKNKISKEFYQNVVVDLFDYDFVFVDEKLEYSKTEIADETKVIFAKLDELLSQYLTEGKCFKNFEDYFDNEKVETTKSAFSKTLCEYCKYKDNCYKRLKEGKEWKR